MVAGCLAFGCTLAPVVTVPEAGTTTVYDDCERAARDYCEEVVGARDHDADECTAKYTFQCVSGTSD